MKTQVMLLTCFLLIQSSFGQLSLDLAKIRPGETYSQTVDPQTIKSVILENILIGDTTGYSIKIKEEKIPVKPFDSSTIFRFLQDNCKDTLYDSLKDQLMNESEEKNVPGIISSLSNWISDADESSCQAETAEAKELIASSRRIFTLIQPVELESGEQITVTVSRGTLLWTFTFTTAEENPWSVLYGFTYVLNLVNNPDNYFAKKDTGNSYLITKQNGLGSSKKVLSNITPTIMFTWKPVNKYRFNNKPGRALFSNHCYQLGFTGGFSLNLSEPTAMVAPSLIFADNLSLSLGVVFIQKYFLSGNYSPGDRILENLTFDQLHEKKYVFDFFISIAFRFDKNIFQKKEAAATTK
jgi:hypothetical protein